MSGPKPGRPTRDGRLVRIAYVFAGADLRASAGVIKKLAAQTAAWTAEGHATEVFFHAHHDPWESGGLNGFRVPVHLFIDEPVAGGATLPAAHRRLRTMNALVASVLEWRPDVVYLRYTVHYPALARLMDRIPTILELNTDDLAEYSRLLPRHKMLYHRLTRGTLLRRARGMVGVTTEIATRPHFTRFGKPMRVIANGIDLAGIRPFPAPAGDRPRLVFLGAPGCPWHGVDKVVELARRCPDWDFDVVGLDADEQGADRLANLRFHGYLTRAEYERILARAVVAIGTLALHRKGMDEASPIKVREYLAYGIPAIVAFRDTDFPDDAEFLCRIPNTPGNVADHLEEIRDFVARMQGVRVPRKAIAHLDAGRKERDRLQFLARCAGGDTSEGRRGR